MTLRLQDPRTNANDPAVGSGALLAVAYGFGTNSTAMLCAMKEVGMKPDIILAADTGAEMPHSYRMLATMQAKVREWWQMEIGVVKKLRAGQFEGLDGECMRGHKLPALAYGSRACSVKYKQQPQNQVIRAEMKKRGVKIVYRAIGFDANEAHRVKPSIQKWAVNWYPLVELQWGRDECVAAICRHGLPQPGKSACYLCPAMKRSEVVRLKAEHPDLLKRALEIEQRSQKTNRTNRGLGGENNKWADWLAMDDAQAKMLLDIEPHEIPCGCIDG